MRAAGFERDIDRGAGQELGMVLLRVADRLHLGMRLSRLVMKTLSDDFPLRDNDCTDGWIRTREADAPARLIEGVVHPALIGRLCGAGGEWHGKERESVSDVKVRQVCSRRVAECGISLAASMKLSEKALLYRELAKLVGADFHLDRSIDLLLRQQPSHARRAWLQGLKSGVDEGRGITDALRAYCADSTGTLEVALIDAGERSGRLGDAFGHLARYFEAWDVALRQAIGAALYPLLLAHLGVVLPALPTLVTASMEGQEPPLRGLFMHLAVLWLILLSLFLAWRWLARLGAKSSVVDAWLGRLPLIGPVRRHWALARFAQVFHACLLASMRMTESIQLAGAASHSGLLLGASRDAARRIAAGETVAGAMADVHGFPTVFIHGVATAEEVGALDREMSRWAAAETIEAGDAIQRAAQWLPRIAYALVAAYVAWRIIGLVGGYYGGLMRQLQAE